MLTSPWTESDLWLDATCTTWLSAIPELMATPELLAYLRYGDRSRSCRRFLMRSVNALENAACVPDRLIARECIGLLYERARTTIYDSWLPRFTVQFGGHRLAHDMNGVLLNVRSNLLCKRFVPLNDLDNPPRRGVKQRAIVHGGRHFRVIRQWREDGTCDVWATLELFWQSLEADPQGRVFTERPTSYELARDLEVT